MAPRIATLLSPARAVALSIPLLLAACDGAAAPTIAPSIAGSASSSQPAGASQTPAGVPASLPPLGDVPMYKADLARSGVQPGPGPLAAPTEAWNTGIDCSPGDATPVLAAGLVIAGCDADKMVAIDARNGTIAWSAALAGPATGFAAGDGAVFVGDATGAFTRLDLATGTKGWSVPLSILRWPVVAGDLVYAGTTDGRFVGVDVADGSVAWSWTPAAGGNEVVGTVLDGVADVATGDGVLHAITLADKKELWSFRVVSGRASTPAITSDTVVVAARANGGEPTGEVYALDRRTGERRWVYRSPDGLQAAPPSVADGVVYVPSVESGMVALDLLTGDVRWHAATGPMGGQALAVAGNAVYAAADRSILAFDRADGHQLWSVDLKADVDNSTLVSGGMVIAADNSGRVRAFAESALLPLLAAGPEASPVSSVNASPAPPAAVGDLLKPGPRFDARTSSLDQPSGMDVGPDGRLYVVNALKDEIVVLDRTDGSIVRRWGNHGTKPGEFDFLRDVTESGSAIGGVAVGADGSVYVADTVNRRVQQFDTEGKVVRTWGRFGSEPGQFLEPIDVAIAPDGSVYVVDDQRDDIQRFTADGAYLATLGSHGSGPGQLAFTGGIDVGPDGTVYVADWDNHRVQAWDDAGTFLWTTGDRGKGPGEFDNPVDVLVDDNGLLHVADANGLQAMDARRQPVSATPLHLDGFFGTLAHAGNELYVSAPITDEILTYRIEAGG